MLGIPALICGVRVENHKGLEKKIHKKITTITEDDEEHLKHSIPYQKKSKTFFLELKGLSHAKFSTLDVH